MINKTSPQRMYYFSHRLKRQLNQIPHYPLTIVEAPSGFGKTTAIREYLRENLPDGSKEYWYTCLGEPASMAWKGICELLANVNSEIALNLTSLEMPTMDTLLHMMALLRDFSCQAETYLVIDNYQLVNCDIPRELMSVFSMHRCQNLHMIFITQQLRTKQLFSIHNADINSIDSSAFFFDREGTASLFRMEGIKLSGDELESVFRSTEGWVSAIRLQIINLQETGSFDNSADIEHLVETAIWKRLMPEEKEFLLSVSVLESFTARQAAIMLGRETLPDNIEDLLKSNDFIRYFPDKNSYTIHSILQEYLRNRFYNLQPEDFQKRILHLAGRSCAAVSQFYLAAQFYLKIKDYDAILSIPFDSQYIMNQKENNILEFIMALTNEAPEETLNRYPFVILIFAYLMLLDGQVETFQKLSRLIGPVIENGSNFSPEERKKLKGEYTMLTAFTFYNDIRMMNDGIRNALEILGGPSSMIIGNMPWVFGSTSVLAMFWRKSGALEDEMKAMDECLPFFRKLTRGLCAGANSVMRAEALLMRGEDDEAEIMCHKALYDARSYQQVSICLCAELTLARIAILRGDVDGYLSAVKNIQGYSNENSNLYVLRLVELCMSVISLAIGIRENVAQWLYDMESIKKVLYSHSAASALTLYSKLLIMDRKYNVFFGISPLLMDTIGKETENVHYMMPQLYHLIFLAIAKHNCGNTLEAKAHLKEALILALPDKIYMPFAQQEGEISSLLESAYSFSASLKAGRIFKSQSSTIIPSEQMVMDIKDDPIESGLHALKALIKRQERGACIIRKAVLQTKSSLTPREREIAGLAKERFSAKEIADRLYISEATVRTILRNVYSKLDVHSKSELNSKEF
jgi:LuxR family transcriptional regulator, maltose regulon positive regulatory protein